MDPLAENLSLLYLEGDVTMEEAQKDATAGSEGGGEGP